MYQTCQHQELLLATSFVPLAERSAEAFILIRLHRAPSSIHLPQLTWGRTGGWWLKGRPLQADQHESELTVWNLGGLIRKEEGGEWVLSKVLWWRWESEGCLVVEVALGIAPVGLDWLNERTLPASHRLGALFMSPGRLEYWDPGNFTDFCRKRGVYRLP